MKIPSRNHLFQFTPLREGRQYPHGSRLIAIYFNSRPSARGDITGARMYQPIPISIHAPPRGATLRVFLCAIRHPYFNSRPSARGDIKPGSPAERRNISIHAPPRGATARCLQEDLLEFISIHAPPRGATGTGTHRKDCEQISIHAPPRGATNGFIGNLRFNIFQFTPLREGRRTAP